MAPSVAIIGPGRVGTAIGVLAAQRGYRVVAVGGRRLEAARRAAAVIRGHPVACSVAAAAERAELLLLTVSDGAIRSVAEDLAKAGVVPAGTVVVHASGALSSGALSSLRDTGCHIASAHPMQTFANVESAIGGLGGCYWFCEGDSEALRQVHELVRAVGGNVVDITTDRKVDYHLAAVFACNYLVVLMDLALLMAGRAGIDRKTAWSAFMPMIDLTLSNIETMDTHAALSGPIRRSDHETLARHLDALRGYDDLTADLYRTLGKQAVQMCRDWGYLSDELAKRITAQLSAGFTDPDAEA